MKKTKRWKLEDCYYGGGTKFDRNYIKNFEGTHIPMHRFRDRRNWKSSHTPIHCKYLEGLIQKYVNKPIEALEQAFNSRTKNVKNHYTFKESFDHLIYEYATHWNRHAWAYKYRIVDGILVRNPEYKSYKRFKPKGLKPYQNIYNIKHIKNPGIVRDYPIKGGFNVGMRDRKPIYLGKLYVEFNDGGHLVDVFHYYKKFPEWIMKKDASLQRKKAIFDAEWCNVNIGIKRLDAFVEESNPRFYYLQKIIQNPDSSEEEISNAKKELKWSKPTVIRNYGLGQFLSPVCKRKDIEKICSRD